MSRAPFGNASSRGRDRSGPLGVLAYGLQGVLARGGVAHVLLLALVLVLTGCSERRESSPPPASRYEAVAPTGAASAESVDAVLADVCDVAHPTGGPAWQWPETTAPVPPNPNQWTWVNFWATWCRPCLEELPTLQQALETGEQAPFALRFLSADTTDEALATFRGAHAFNAPSPRLEDPNALTSTLEAAGFRGAASLPVHVLVDPYGHVRCVRAGQVNARHLERILAAVRSSQ